MIIIFYELLRFQNQSIHAVHHLADQIAYAARKMVKRYAHVN